MGLYFKIKFVRVCKRIPRLIEIEEAVFNIPNR